MNKRLQEKILLEEPVEDSTLSNVPEIDDTSKVELPSVELEQPITISDTELEQVAEVDEEVEKDAFISLFASEVSKNYSSIDELKSAKATVSDSSLDASMKESIIEKIEGLIDNRTLEIGIFESILEELDPEMTSLIDDGKEQVESETKEEE